ncbi:MAG: OmpA family protein [Campylobacteraceae bacterium]|jgi:OOP family OmpA-OmpF porin|nr:OmpA family protein [Campylobacteraceae bacterium]
MKRTLLSIAACTVIAVAGVNEVTPTVGGVYPLNSDKFDEGPTYGIRIGLGLNTIIDQVEFAYDYSPDIEYGNGQSTHTNRLYLNAIKDFKITDDIVLYGITGIGHEDISGKDLKDYGGTFWQYGAGLKYYFSNNMALRAEIRHALKFKSMPADDLFYTVGLTIPFGNKQEPVVVEEQQQQKPPSLIEIYIEDKEEVIVEETVEEPVVEQEVEEQQPVAEEQRSALEEAVLKAMALSIPGFDPSLSGTHRYYNFNFNNVDILEKDKDVADAIAKDLGQFEGVRLRTEGHTDALGSKWYNLKLSQKRANIVKNELIKSGIAPNQIETKGYGFDYPIAPNTTEEGRAANRRTEVLFAATVAYFGFNSAVLPEEGDKAVKLIADKLEGFDSVKIRAEGHADSVGSKWYNLKLSQNRAAAVKNKLVEYGVDADRVETKGFSDDKPLKSNDTEDGRAANRRVDVLFVNPNR